MAEANSYIRASARRAPHHTKIKLRSDISGIGCEL